ncbi:MAG: DUF2271 domain-containing protein [Myxococcales bacterium]|jgi:hypothetical protein
MKRVTVGVPAVPLLVALAAGGCGAESDPAFSPDVQSEHPLAGLFTPGSRIGYREPAPGAVMADGGSTEGLLSGEDLAEIEASIEAAGLEDRCELPADAPEGTPGMVEVEFETASYGGFYAPLNCGAVWIEDDEGRYVATPMIWAGVRRRNIFIWNARRCQTDGPDVISAATLDDHSGTRELSWDTRDHMGRVVPDGSYVLNIEVTEDEFNYGRRAEIPFEKGTDPVSLSPADTESVMNLMLTYTPMP